MNIKTTSGHLTAHDKRVIVAILKANGTGANTPRKAVKIVGNEVWITTNETDWNGPRSVTHKASFAVEGGIQ